MEARAYQKYKEQSINTMTPGELLLLLYDELVKRLMKAEIALDNKEYEIFEESVTRSIDIVNYLDDTLDRQYPISSSLAQMYEYFTYELGRARIGRNKDPLSRVKRFSCELRDAFREAQKNAELIR